MDDTVLAHPGMVVLETGPERAFGVSHAVADSGEVVSVMPSGRHLLGPAGLPPGGAIGVLIDDNLGFAIMLRRPANLWSVSGEISLDLCQTLPSDGSPIIARGRHVYTGPHAGFAMGTVTDADGRLLGTCRQASRRASCTAAGRLASSRSAPPWTASSPARSRPSRRECRRAGERTLGSVRAPRPPGT